MRTFTTLSIRHLILATAAGLMLAPVVDDAHAQEFPPDAVKGKAVYEQANSIR